MLKDLQNALAAQGVESSIEVNHYLGAGEVELRVGNFSVREARGHLYASFVGLGNYPFSDVQAAASWIAERANDEAPEYIS